MLKWEGNWKKLTFRVPHILFSKLTAFSLRFSCRLHISAARRILRHVPLSLYNGSLCGGSWQRRLPSSRWERATASPFHQLTEEVIRSALKSSNSSLDGWHHVRFPTFAWRTVRLVLHLTYRARARQRCSMPKCIDFGLLVSKKDFADLSDGRRVRLWQERYDASSDSMVLNSFWQRDDVVTGFQNAPAESALSDLVHSCIRWVS